MSRPHKFYRQMVMKLSALHPGRPPFTPRKIPGTHFCWRLDHPQAHSAAGRIIRLTEKSSDHITNQTHNLLACGIVPEPTTLPHAPNIEDRKLKT
jgi:hypothetical protein